MRTGRKRWLAFGSLGILSGAGYLAAALVIRSDYDLPDFLTFLGLFGGLSVLWLVALWLVPRARPGAWLLIGFALLFRLSLLPAGYDWKQHEWNRSILYDDDIWRYLWESHVWSAGISPLDTPPAELEEYELELDSPALHAAIYNDPIWGRIYDNVSYRQFASPYPHVAHAVFRLSHFLKPGSLVVWRLLMIAFDLGTLLLLRLLGRKLGAGLWPLAAYGWNPLVVKELAGSAHLDAILVFFLVAAVAVTAMWVKESAGFSLGLAALVKPAPLALLPAFFKRLGWVGVLPGVGALVLLFISTPAGMRSYAREWVFNQGLSRLLPQVRALELLLPVLAVLVVAAAVYRRDDCSLEALVKQALWVLGAFLLTTPMAAPWYLTWVLPFAALRRSWFWLIFSVTAFLSYHGYLEMREYPVLVAVEYLTPALVWVVIRRRRAALAGVPAKMGAWSFFGGPGEARPG